MLINNLPLLESEKKTGKIVRKSDEFFHLLIAFLAFGFGFVVFHLYKGLILSIGVALITFAFLEITAIYFPLVRRVLNVFYYFIKMIPETSSWVPSIWRR
ncbi:transmembrane protein 40-like [Erpetoichthys calabaricus]|uniref:transmembrane protein 40-like n=1 Tax=Erpetoichthys calabaricus TaxID=27687 RepID=UPI0022342B20|nr:transmembrane protein 40-like [Erpetoichthys calabaricus]